MESRFRSIEERNKAFMQWVSKNGMPKLSQGCINCNQLTCFEDCKGIEDERVRLIQDEL